MTKIHMDTEITKNLAVQMHQAAIRMQETQHRLNNQISGLPYIWEGDDAFYFAQDAGSNLREYQGYIDILQNLSTLLDREIEQWIQVDMDGCGKLGSIGQVLGSNITFGAGAWGSFSLEELISSGGWTIAGGIAVSGGMAGWISLPTGQYEWKDLLLEFADEGLDTTYDFLKEMPLKDYKELGREWNKFIGDSKGGGVGTFDEIGHIIKSDTFAKAFDFAGDTGFEFVDGLLDGEPVDKALISAGLTSLAGVGLHCIPGVGTVLAVSDGIQFAGNIVACGLELAGYHEAAGTLQNSLEVIDLGGYVSNFADDVTDWILKSSTTTRLFRGSGAV